MLWEAMAGHMRIPWERGLWGGRSQAEQWTNYGEGCRGQVWDTHGVSLLPAGWVSGFPKTEVSGWGESEALALLVC